MWNNFVLNQSNGLDVSVSSLRLMFKTLSDTFLIPTKQLPRVLFHGVILAVIICGFWLLDSLKDPILTKTVGIEYQPTAKFLSVMTTMIVVCIYDYSTSIFRKPMLFHLVSGIFGLMIMIMAAELSHPDYGLPNRDKGPQRILGWVCYFAIESYGSLMVALFWSFTNSIMNLEEAKGAYGLIISIAQIGAMIGSTLATNASTIGIPQLFFIASVTIFSVSLLIKIYHIIFNDKATEARGDIIKTIYAETQNNYDRSDENEVLIAVNTKETVNENYSYSFLDKFYSLFAGFVEGLLLILKYRYIQYLLGISCLYEIVVTVLDYQFKLLGADVISTDPTSNYKIDGGLDDSNKFANLMGHFGQLTNFLSFIISFFGFSFLVHKLGVKFTLLIFPMLLFFSVILAYISPSFWVLFIMVSLLKALIFSLNEPVKELLYIPTSDPIKFKAKAWIDVFGSRLAKAAGSSITSIAAGNIKKLRNISEIPCIVVAVMMIVLSWIIGLEFNRLTNENIVIGNDSNNDTNNDSNNVTFAAGIINGRKPGEIGYEGYDLQVFRYLSDNFDNKNDDEMIKK